MTAAGLDAVSDGRFVLGLGASGPQVIEGWHGVPYDRPLTRPTSGSTTSTSAWRRARPSSARSRSSPAAPSPSVTTTEPPRSATQRDR